MKGHARQLMTTHYNVAFPSLTIANAAREFAQVESSAFPVVDENEKVIGIVTETDVLAALLRVIPVSTPISDIMKSPVITVDEFTPADTVIRIMQEEEVHHLPVTRGGMVVGMITPQEVIRYFVNHQLPLPPDVA